jgi:hypothetical protein
MYSGGRHNLVLDHKMYDPEQPGMYSGGRHKLVLDRSVHDGLCFVMQRLGLGLDGALTRVRLRIGEWDVGGVCLTRNHLNLCVCHAETEVRCGIVSVFMDAGRCVGAFVIVENHAVVWLVGDDHGVLPPSDLGFKCDVSIGCPEAFKDDLTRGTIDPTSEFVDVTNAPRLNRDITLWYDEQSIGFVTAERAVVQRGFERGLYRLYTGTTFVGWMPLWDGRCCGLLLLNGTERDSFPVDESLVKWFE